MLLGSMVTAPYHNSYCGDRDNSCYFVLMFLSIAYDHLRYKYDCIATDRWCCRTDLQSCRQRWL